MTSLAQRRGEVSKRGPGLSCHRLLGCRSFGAALVECLDDS